jgi:hypothetical protein
MSTGVCIVCGKSGDAETLGVWFVEQARSLIHVDCWVAEYKAGNLHTSPPEQRPVGCEE